MLSRWLTADEVRRTFERLFAHAMSGTYPHTCSGVGSEVEDALTDIADAYPDIPAALVDAARNALEQQAREVLSPPTEAERLEEWARSLGIDPDDR